MNLDVLDKLINDDVGYYAQVIYQRVISNRYHPDELAHYLQFIIEQQRKKEKEECVAICNELAASYVDGSFESEAVKECAQKIQNKKC